MTAQQQALALRRWISPKLRPAVKLFHVFWKNCFDNSGRLFTFSPLRMGS
jgi:hypothetical protein